jgi:hypothetical protein
MSIDALLKTNVNGHVEKKNGLSYLSWAWAWAEALKADPKATFKVEMFGDKCYMEINGTAMVWVTVTMFDKPMSCQLPVMDFRNKAIPNPDAFAVNTAIMRCMTKALSLHGLGLYIYAGEDVPEEPKKIITTPNQGAQDNVSEQDMEELRDLADLLNEMVIGEPSAAKELVTNQNLDEPQKLALWTLLNSKTRAALKKKD